MTVSPPSTGRAPIDCPACLFLGPGLRCPNHDPIRSPSTGRGPCQATIGAWDRPGTCGLPEDHYTHEVGRSGYHPFVPGVSTSTTPTADEDELTPKPMPTPDGARLGLWSYGNHDPLPPGWRLAETSLVLDWDPTTTEMGSGGDDYGGWVLASPERLAGTPIDQDLAAAMDHVEQEHGPHDGRYVVSASTPCPTCGLPARAAAGGPEHDDSTAVVVKDDGLIFAPVGHDPHHNIGSVARRYVPVLRAALAATGDTDALVERRIVGLNPGGGS